MESREAIVLEAAEKNGALREFARVRIPGIFQSSISEDTSYYVAISALRDGCPDFVDPPPDLLSASSLVAAVRNSGGLNLFAAARLAALSAAALTPEAFAQQLTEAVRQKIPALGANPSLYGKAIQRVAEIVRLCSALSAKDFVASMEARDYNRFARYLGGRYRSCGEAHESFGPLGSGGLLVPPGQEPGLEINFDLSERWLFEKKTWNGPKLHIKVYLKEIHADVRPSVAGSRRRLLLLEANIKDGPP
jgi:hypothetical protein